MIGDISPKPISALPSEPTKIEPTGKVTEGSAWNAANTWEERDTTSWGKAKLSEVFSSSDSTATKKVRIQKIEKIEGHSSITHVRGRARFLYEWNFSLDFEVTGLMGSFSGSATISDVINDQLSDIEIEIKWKNPKPTILDGRSLQSALKEEIMDRMKQFETEYQNYRK